MDGTFTVSSQSDRSPLSGATLCILALFYLTAVTLPREDEVVILNSVLFQTSAFDIDASDDLKVISKDALHVLNFKFFVIFHFAV